MKTTQKFYSREHMEKSLLKAFVRDMGWDTGTLHVEWEYDQDDCIVGARVIREETKALKPLRWVDARGRVLEIPKMDTEHLKNAFAWLDEVYCPHYDMNTPEYHWGLAMMRAFSNELDNRGE